VLPCPIGRVQSCIGKHEAGLMPWQCGSLQCQAIKSAGSCLLHNAQIMKQ
jgi:hypothetical protein